MRVAVITGITGQDGAYLANFLLRKNYKVIGLTRNKNTLGLLRLQYLGIKQDIIIEEVDILDLGSFIKILKKYKPDEIYNLAAQSSVSLSFSQPTSTIHNNVTSVLNILEAIRLVDFKTKMYQASSSEMYGKAQSLPITINTAMHPSSPYGISKATGYWTVVNYRESYNLFACNGVLFNHESALRPKNFFIKKVIIKSLQIANGSNENLIVGNIDVSRDFGYAPEYVEAMWLMLQNELPSDVIICSGKAVSLRNIIYYIFDKFNIDRNRIIIDEKLFRPSEIQTMYGDASLAKENLNWEFKLDFFDVLDILIEEEIEICAKGYIF